MPECVVCHARFRGYIRRPAPGELPILWNLCPACIHRDMRRTPDEDIPPADPHRPSGSAGREHRDSGRDSGRDSRSEFESDFEDDPFADFAMMVTDVFPAPICIPGMACSICLEPMNDITQINVLTCGHLFHADCAANLAPDRRGNRRCPLCRVRISGNLRVFEAYPISRTAHSPTSAESDQHIATIRHAIAAIPADTAAADAAAARARIARLAMESGVATRPSMPISAAAMPPPPALPMGRAAMPPPPAPPMGRAAMPRPIMESGSARSGPNTQECVLCHTAFSPIVTRYHCISCGYNVCRNCSRETEDATGRNVRICTSCYR